MIFNKKKKKKNFRVMLYVKNNDGSINELRDNINYVQAETYEEAKVAAVKIFLKPPVVEVDVLPGGKYIF